MQNQIMCSMLKYVDDIFYLVQSAASLYKWDILDKSIHLLP